MHNWIKAATLDQVVQYFDKKSRHLLHIGLTETTKSDTAKAITKAGRILPLRHVYKL